MHIKWLTYFKLCTSSVVGALGPVTELRSIYNVMDNTINIFWTPPTAITVPPALTPEIFYCIQISNGTETEQIACNKSVDRNSNISITVKDIMCQTHYNVMVTPFNRRGGNSPTTLELPGKT